MCRFQLCSLILILIITSHKDCRAQRLRLNRQGARLLGHGSVGSGSAGLWPSVFNVASKATITANATCGEKGREEYCKLLDHAPRRSRAPQCGVCDAHSPDPHRRHHASHATDGTGKWWQSPTLQHGKQYEYVTITLDLGQIYQIAYVIVKAANSPRPASWILERSIDGDTYTAWQYYAASDEECSTRYGIEATPGKPKYNSDSDVICTSYYSKLYPLENGEIHTSLVNGRPGANDSSIELLNFTLARYVRLRLQQMRTLQTAGEQLQRWLPSETAQAKRHFYSIRDINIGGQCVCSGHAGRCRHTSGTGNPECECVHNTCGTNCERCCPLYNQFPFHPGTTTAAHVCERCQCHGHATECIYDPLVDAASASVDSNGIVRGGGVCVDCMKNTTGNNCERCLPGFYRPLAISPDDEIPCIPCDCDTTGSTGLCNIGSLAPGECECLPGFTGPRCERCAPGHRGPHCSQCPCDIRGTMPGGECEVICQCKFHVEGSHCDTCQSGYFSLRAEHSVGCLPCYCSGVGATCRPAEVEASSYETLDGWLVTDIGASYTVSPTIDSETGDLTIADYELSDVEAYYWLAPTSYAGNKLTSYGSRLIVDLAWVVMRGDTSGKPTTGPNLILVGKNGLKIAFGDDSFNGDNVTLSILLKEDNWYHVPKSVRDIVTRLRRTEYRGDPVNRAQFMSVIADIKHVLVRAKFHTDQADGIMQRAVLYAGGNEIQENNFNLVEQCDCPPGYTGLSCETCAYSYIRMLENSSLHVEQKKCIKCDCSGHSESCDLVTGKCGPCAHNTIGEKCERCEVGFYGNPLLGTWGDCKRCACPLLADSNNFSPSCQLEVTNFAIDGVKKDYVCTQCPEGYIGDHCEICDDGYFGSPTTLGSSCNPCPCDGSPCDALTGACVTCAGNTEGWRCERCKAHYHGTPAEGCEPCACDVEGSASSPCDATTGQCACKENYAGRRCDKCELGYANVTDGCQPCACDPMGSEDPICDPHTGTCRCKPGVGGTRCNNCTDMHFGLTQDGCQGCSCNTFGSVDRTCDIITGQCRCHTNVAGKTCDTCQHGHWNIGSGLGCVACDHCDPLGCHNGGCEQVSGSCYCKPGVTGYKCDTCAQGYFGFSDRGCQVCEQCTKPGYVCDPDTGRCVCPQSSHGEACSQCYTNFWGNEIGKGCKSCNCHTTGSNRSQCDVYSGQCECKEGYTGMRCEACAPGYHSFPHCRRCQCDIQGSAKELCNLTTGLCRCDESGQCPCKENVFGKKCDTCTEGTFGLSEDNPDGCTRCYCFGRTSKCSQAGLTWGQIRSQFSRNLILDHLAGYPHGIGGNKVHIITTTPDHKTSIFLDVTIGMINTLSAIPGYDTNITLGINNKLNTPIYWQLPNTFTGDHIVSYGGFLKFSSQTSNGTDKFSKDILNYYPLVEIRGHDRVILEYYETIPSTTESYSVRFHESLWKLQNRPNEKVGRDIMMVALQNITSILLRVSPYADFSEVVLSNVLMDTAILVPGAPSPTASDVELCECPAEYDSLSCQDPSIGFYRRRTPQNDSSTIIIEVLVGDAKACECNGRSKMCDRETGYCEDCKDNTAGEQCDKCAEGFYGDPLLGSCSACPCPEAGRNFSKSCKTEGREIMCHCKEGYTGRRCDHCALGHHGYPRLPGGSCAPCKCHPDGRASEECDEETGQCNCKPGVTGKDCSMCALPRHTFQNHQCTPCDNCTQTLFDTIHEMSSALKSGTRHIDAGNIPAPWPTLLEIGASATNLKQKLDNLLETKDRIRNIPDTEYEDLQNKTKLLENRAHEMWKNADKIKTDAFDLNNNADNLLNNVIIDTRNQLDEIYTELDHYGKTDHHLNVDKAVKEAERLLKELKHISLDELSKKTKDILEEAKILLKFLTENGKMIGEQEAKLKEMEQKFRHLMERIDDLVTTNDNVKQNTKDASTLHEANTIAFETYLNKSSMIKEMENYIDNEISRANLTCIQPANVFLDDYRDNMLYKEDLRDNLKNLSSEVLEIEGILNRLAPLYKETYVIPAQKHAQELFARANQYKNRFSEIRHDAANALTAVKAYQDIVDAIQNALEAAQNATDAADAAHLAVNPINKDTLAERSDISKADSSRILERAKQKLLLIEPLEGDLKQNKKIVDGVSSTIWQTANLNNDIESKLNELDDRNSTNITASAVIADAMRETKRSQGAQKEASDIRNNAIYTLRPKIPKDEAIKLGEAAENMSTFQRDLQEADGLLNHLTNKIANKEWNNTLANKLKQLKDKITEAKQNAETIRVSLTNDPDTPCIRSYKPTTLNPSTTTSIVMKISVPINVNNSALVYMSGDHKEFIALEMVDRKIRFLWNLGGNTGIVTHSLRLESRDAKVDEAWYMIEVKRTSNVGSLDVQQQGVPSEGTPPATNFSNPEYTRFDVEGGLVYLGGLPDTEKYHPPELQAPNGLTAIIDQFYLDGKLVGLWNFVRNSNNVNQCHGAVEGPFETRCNELNVYYFNGLGYSVVERSSTRPDKSHSIQMNFKTLDENALLFLAVDKDNNRSVSIYLENGRVVFAIDYGVQKLKIISVNTYNNGKWVKVDATRYFDNRKNAETGRLKVNDDTYNGAPSTPILSTSVPDLQSASYYIGGVPSWFQSYSSEMNYGSFLGYIKELQMNSEGYNPYSTKYYGVETSCFDKPLTMSGFFGNGYLELPSYSLQKSTSFSLVFRTVQENALLMLTAFDNSETEQLVPKEAYSSSADTTSIPVEIQKGYYSIAIENGKISLHINSGTKEIRLQSNSTVNDGDFHVVTVIKSGRRIELRVDDVLQTAKNLTGKPASVKAPEASGGLYLGGVPDGLNDTNMAASNAAFIGAIKDLTFNEKLVLFNDPVSFRHAAIGRIGPNIGPDMDSTAQGTEPMTRIKTLMAPEGCLKIGSYSLEVEAGKFGDGANSHAEVHMPIRNIFQRDHVIEFDFRSFYPNGLLFVSPGNKIKQRHYVLVVLRDGELSLLVKGRHKKELPLRNTKLNDGLWHHVVLSAVDKKTTLSIDGHTSAQMKLPKKLNVANMMYVGGLPAAGHKLPDNLLDKLEGFKGCIRSLKVNKNSQDLVRSGMHNNVRQCFPHVEKGSFFPGDAYAIYDKNFHVGKVLELQLEFRTSEMTGVLLSITDSFGSALSLEVHNGKVIMSVDLGVHDRSTVHGDFTSEHALCDNRWHTISALFNSEELTVRVDSTPSRSSVKWLHKSYEFSLDGPLYIGGLPENAPSGTLQTRDNFKGCIRNVVIAGSRKDWTDMDALHNIMLSSCPVEH